MTRGGDVWTRWTALAVAALCVAAWLGNAAHVALAAHGHHHVGSVHEHEHDHDHERPSHEPSSPPSEGDPRRGVEPHPSGHDVDDHRLAEAIRTQQPHLLSLPDSAEAPGLIVTPRAGSQRRPPALDEDPPDPAPPSGALRVRAPPAG